MGRLFIWKFSPGAELNTRGVKQKEGPIQGCVARLVSQWESGALTYRVFEEPWSLMAPHLGD